MLDILMILAILLFLVFLVSGLVSHFKKTGRKWIYLTLSALSLVGVILTFSYSNLNNRELEKSEKNTVLSDENDVQKEEKETKTSNDKKQDDQIDVDQEKPPKNEIPDVIDEPKEGPDPEPIKQPSKTATPVPTTPQKISVPDKGTIDYKVAKGDTLWSIATRAGVNIEKLKQWNKLESDMIHVGQILRLYGKGIEPSVPVNPPKQKTPTVSTPSRLISNGSLKQKEIAFTFDAGSDAVGIRILDILNKHHVKATFFLTGKWAEKYPSYARRIVNDGHEIGNHTYSHPDAVTISGSALKLEISKSEQAIKKASGKSPRPYFRFPYGSYNASSLKSIGEVGYPYSIQWSLDTIDWKQPSVEVITSRIEKGASNGDIILMHIGGQNTPEAVDQVIPLLKSKGYQMVTLSELLK